MHPIRLLLAVLSVSHAGLTAAVSLDPAQLDGALAAGAASDHVVLLRNSGAAPVEWQATAVQDAGAGEGLALTPFAAGGDAFGYRWADSTEPDGPAFEWVEAAGPVTTLSLADDDAQGVDLPFDFVFYGIRYDSVRVSSNGYLTFGPDGSDHTHEPIPSTQSPNALIAPYWCDLDPTLGGEIAAFDDPLNDRFVVQYTDIQRFGGGAGNSFQVVLHASGDITFNYPSSTGIGALADQVSVGIENADGTMGSSVAYNSAFAPSGLAVRFYSPTWLSVAPLSGTLASGESIELTVSLNAGALVAGTYTGTIDLTSDGGSAALPVELVVSGSPRIAVSQLGLAFDAVGVGGQDERFLDIRNPGTDSLQVTGLLFSDADFSAAVDVPFLIEPGGASRVVIRFNPQSVGAYAGLLTIQSNDPGVPQVEVELVAEGLAPADIDVAPAALELSLPAGDSGSLPLRIGNSGIAPLNWRAVLDGQLPEAPAPAVATASNPVVQAPIEPDFSRPYAVDRMIVRFDDTAAGPLPGGGPSRREQLAEQAGASARRAAGLARGLEVWELRDAPAAAASQAVGPQAAASPEARTEALIRWMRRQPGVLYAEPDYIIQIDTPAESSSADALSGADPATFPGDPFFGNLWGLHNTGQEGGTPDADIDAPEAWLLQTGAPEVIVAVIDTGVDYTHPDIAANMWMNPGEIPGNGLDDDGNGYIDDVYGWDFANRNRDPMDDHNHGTHCAGTIAAVGDNGTGITGVAWQARIMALKFLDAGGSGLLSDALGAIAYAADNGAQVSNSSWGGGGFSQAMVDTIAAAGEQGLLFVAAAGNDSRNNDTSPTYPATYDLPNVISVAATTRNDELAYFSNYGASTVHLGAPGQAILSTIRNNSYALFNGTSMAAPHVSGAAAMVLGKNPLLSIDQLKAILTGSVDPVPALAGRTISGGRLNLRNALDAVAPPWFELIPNSGTEAPGGSLLADVVFSADSLPAGVLNGDILLFSDDPDEPLLTVPVTLTVTSAPGIALQSAGLEFGDVYQGGAVSQPFTLRNSGTEPLQVFSAAASGPFTVSGGLPATLAPGERMVLEVTATAGPLGPMSGLLEIASDDPTDPLVGASLTATSVAAPAINVVTGRLDSVLRSGGAESLPLLIANSGVNALDYRFAGDLPGWLTIGPASGAVPAGGSVEVAFQIDAGGMAAGQYAAAVELTSNDPARASQQVLVVLEVLDGALLQVDPDAVDFQIVYLGHPQDRGVTLRNLGNAALSVASTSVSGTGFALVSGFSGALQPGQSATLTLRANPAAAGLEDGALAIASDAPDAPLIGVPLAMDARPAPALQVDPASFALALDEGASAGRTLNIANTGLDVLNVSLQVEPEGSGSALGEILASHNITQLTGDRGILTAEYLNGRFYVAGQNAGPNIPQIYVLDSEGNYLSQFSLPGVAAGSWGARDMASDGFFLYAGWSGGIVKFDTNGTAYGVVPVPPELNGVNALAHDPASDHFYAGNFSSDILEIDRSGNIIRRFAQPAGMENLFGLAWDDATPGGPYLWVAEIKELQTRKIHQFDPAAGAFTGLAFTVNPALGWSAGLAFTTDWRPGQATLIAITQATDDWMHLVNLADVQNWLRLDTYSLSVAPGADRDVQLSMDATGVPGGQHVAHIRVLGNDPVTPERAIPVTLQVTGTAQLELPAAAIDFGTGAFVGGERVREFRIRNSGTDVLDIQSLTVSGTAFALVDDAPSTLDPQQSRALEVAFAPDATGPFSGTLSIASNDPAQPLAEIPLTGEAVAAPVLDMDTSAVDLTLYAGEERTFVLEIGNPGGSPLVWQGGAHKDAAAVSQEMAPAALNLLPALAREIKLDPSAPLRVSAEPVPGSPKPLPYADDFESGRWSDSWFTSYGTGKAEVTSTTAGEGTYSFHYYGQTSGGHRKGIHQQFVPSRPDYLAFRVRAGSVSQSDAYVTIGDELNNEAIFFFSNQAGYWHQTEFPSGDVSQACDPARWYHVECRDIDWSSRTFDYYMDGELIKRGVGFRSPSVDSISRLNLYNFSADSEAWWDDIRVGVNTATWVRLSSANGAVAPGGLASVAVTVSAAYLEAGSYAAAIVVNSNDPGTPQRTLPVGLAVQDAPGIHLPDTEMDFGGVVVGAAAQRGLRVANSGTQPLVISGLTSGDPAFSSSQALPLTIQPGASALIPVSFSPSATGVVTTQLQIASNSPFAALTDVAFSGTGVAAPTLAVNATPIALTVAAGQSLDGFLTVANSGGGELVVEALFETEAVRGGGPAPGEAGISRAGGPDGFGYTYRDETEPDGPVFQWREIAPPQGGDGIELETLTGTTPPKDCNLSTYNFVDSLPLDFDFPFYGIERDAVSISAFGALFFEGGPTQGIGCYIPFPGLPHDMVATGRGTNAFIATYHERLQIVPGAVYYRMEGDRLIVEHYRVTRTSQEYATFQTILYPNGDIRMQWYETGPWLTGGSATIGIQGNASTALQYARWTAGAVAPGRCIYFTYPGNPYRDWLRPAIPEAALAGGEEAQIGFSASAQFLLPGVYNGSIELRTNDPGQPLLSVPVTLTVTDPATDALTLVRKVDGAVVEGGLTALTENNLYAAAPGAGKADIQYTVVNNGYGTMLLDGAPAAQFTQQDLADNRVSYQHDGSDAEAVSTISLQVSDGTEVFGPFGLLIAVTAVNDPPVITGPAGFSASAGVQEALDGMMVDDPDISHIYADWRLTLEVSHGTIWMDTTIGGVFNGGIGSVQNNGTAKVTVETWLSRLQTNFGTPGGIRYTANPGSSGSDQLEVTLNDNGNTGSGPGYEVSHTFPITVHASDYARWQHDHFPESSLTDPAQEATVWGDDANPDGDPYDNLFEYILFADPLAPEEGQRIEHGYDGVHQWLRFPVRLQHPGIQWQVEWSETLAGPWSTASVLLEELELHPQYRVMRARLPFVDPGARFLRLNVWKE
jgi:subtilisin family serine protease